MSGITDEVFLDELELTDCYVDVNCEGDIILEGVFTVEQIGRIYDIALSNKDLLSETNS